MGEGCPHGAGGQQTNGLKAFYCKTVPTKAVSFSQERILKNQLLARSRLSVLLVCLVACLLPLRSALADSTLLLNDVRTIATAGIGKPLEFQFDITAPGTYAVTLSDIGAQQTPAAPLASVKMALADTKELVGTPLTAAGTLQFTAAAAGSYSLHVVGVPGPVPGSGSVAIKVTSADGATLLYGFSGVIGQPAQQVATGTAVLDDSFTVTTAGIYQVTLSDLNLPHSLSLLTLAILSEGVPTPVLTLPDSSQSLQGSATLQPGVTYRIFAIGQADPTAAAGLFSATVLPAGGGSPTYAKTVPVGNSTLVSTQTLTAGPHTFVLADLQYPEALTQLQSVVVSNGQVAQSLAAAGSASFTAVAGSYDVYAVATPAAQSAGSYSIQLTPQGGAAEMSLARAVADPTSGSTAFSFDTSLSSAGAYTANLQNFSAPVPLTAVRMAAVQGGVVIGTPITATGSIALNGAAGPLTLLVIAQADATLGGLFDVNVTASGSTSLLYDMAQPVGAASSSEKLSITAAGSYDIVATDLAFPSPFQSFVVTVTQGGNLIGSINTLGKLSLTAAAGNYFVNVLARPADTDKAGTYLLTAAATQAAPVITFAANPTTIDSGKTSSLSWDVKNATNCTATGGWTGSQTVKDSFTTPVLTTSTTYTLTCTGEGGQASQSVTVTVNPPAKGGGGGSIDSLLLIALLVAVAERLTAHRGRAQT